VTLRRGDRLPIVAYGQWLLGQHPALAGDSLSVDGIFGPRTEEAVRAAQADEGVPVTGELVEPLWSILKRGIGDRMQVIESIGIGSTSTRHGIRGFDPDVLADRNHVGDGDPDVSIIAEETRVPVSAAFTPQMGGAASNRFEGPVRTVFPGPMTLPSWARRQVGNRSFVTL